MLLLDENWTEMLEFKMFHVRAQEKYANDL